MVLSVAIGGIPISQNPDNPLLLSLSRLGGAAPIGKLAASSGLTRPTAHRALAKLVQSHAILHSRSGYALAADPTLNDGAQLILAVLREHGLDAHLTGFDLLASHAQQFMRADVPHLVYADPLVLDEVRLVLVQKGLTVLRPHPGAYREDSASARVVVRAVSGELSDRLGVIAWRAIPEKAWVDLARETLKDVLPISHFDCGQILGAAVRAGVINRRRVRSIARAANLTRIVRALDNVPRTPAEAALAAGEAAEGSNGR